MSRYTLENIKRTVRQPSLLVKKRRYINRDLNRKFLTQKNNAIDIFSKEWDNLIILDAARYDRFCRLNDHSNILPGSTNLVFSKGRNSWEFVYNNFANKSLYDTIYITSNVHYQKLNENPFFNVESFLTLDGRTSPEKVIDMTIKMNKKYPNKKLITHMMFPHAPYTSSEAEEARRKVEDECGIDFALTNRENSHSETGSNYDLHSLLNAAEHGYISDSTLHSIYNKELTIGMEYASELIRKLDGRSIITSDHGELLGDRLAPLFFKDYGHGTFNSKILTQVPWHVIDGERRKIHEDPPLSQKENADKDIQESLKALGYV